MKKVNCIYIITLLIVLAGGLPGMAARYEGEIAGVNPAEQSLVLVQANCQEQTFKLAHGAKLYYNNVEGSIGMYAPVTADDFVSGYLDTNDKGLVQSAHFFYLVREGSIQTMASGSLTLKETESGICDSYPVSGSVQVFLNNYPSEMTRLQTGMKVLVVLDHHFQIKKVAAFHYEYTGFVQQVDVTRQTVVINIGTRLSPDLREYRIGCTLKGNIFSWEALAEQARIRPLIYAKFIVDPSRNTISYIDVRSL